ncbi:beta-ketoacyl synthase N-terminal-like domain-containing protein [sulfur-oxidizing endosymbiont of Gigantopelta aegis]|uniref:beta-ketoacyl synthase N-terminal-like domain-containing protein n=1 Tax=sulfur-oxidizing endosymbiont of Gigantopelta aegis TaxID=2794934 RepID=UPI0018DCEC9C|nr:beta-ketoacyl synthase N-terminal-like domain-containing protein [sulfur-oxidizing endosymbiont of Gigantopelta aegis]
MEKIAIIGTACLFPEADTPEAYWENLVANKDSRVAADAEHMGRDPEDYFSPKKDTKDKYYCTTGGYINGFQFNADDYDLAPEKLSGLDNTFQWALHVSREALKDAGYDQQQDKLSRCGVILGNLSFPTKKSNQLFLPLYHQAMASPLKELLGDPNFKMGDKTTLGETDTDDANGMVAGHPASVINQALALGDVSMVLDAACASSLYSMKLACSYLLSGKADMMLAGAVSAADPWFVSLGFSTFKAFPENVASRPLDKTSSGLNTGEGAGMFVLKRYDDALRDGDHIHALISGIGLSNDGKGKFVLSPNDAGQEICYERAYNDSDINPEDVDYIECHATGTPLGDATEIRSMENFFADKDVHFSMGTAKSNFGHLLTSAGMAGMLKIILSMKNDLIPATINVNESMQSGSDKIAGDKILAKNIPWPKSASSSTGNNDNNSDKKIAAISAFGFGGTNAHLIMEEHITGDEKMPASAKQALKNQPSIKSEKISIVGMGAHFGQSENLAELENTIYQSKQLRSALPKDRWQGIEKDTDLLKQFAVTENGVTPQGNFINQFDFDHLYFKIPPEEQAPLLPQQLLMMKVLDEALQDAALPKGGNIGVIVAMEMDLGIHQFRGRIDAAWQLQESLANSNIQLSAEQEQQLTELLKDSLHNAVEINQFTSFIGNIIPCRICSLWDFSGPAFTISSEENSVFKALEVAKLFLDAGEVDAMVVGAVDLAGGIEHVYLQNQRNKMSASTDETQSNSAFSVGDGTAWSIGEGAGAIVLKRNDQITDERVYARIEGFSGRRYANADDAQQSLTQAADEALTQADIQREEIDYIELNSSGIAQQDKAEVDLLQHFFSAARTDKDKPKQTCALGSVKANIGHTFAASGMASLIKTSLCLYQRFIPGIPAWDKPQNKDDWNEEQFHFPADSRPWLLNSEQKKRYAAINNLGQDNTAFHLILSEADKKQIPKNNFFANLTMLMFPIVGDNEQALQIGLSTLASGLLITESLHELSLKQLAEFKTNKSKAYRISLLASSAEELQRQITAAQKGISSAFESNEEWSTPLGSYFTPTPQAAQGKIAFVYPGGFNSYIGMAKDIFHMFPEVVDLVSEATSSLRKMMRTHYVYTQTLATPDKKELKRLDAVMGDDAVAMFESGIMASILYTKVIQDILGVQPQAAFGHSMGELSMLFSSGAWSNTDYMSNTLHNTATFQNRLVGEMEVVRQAWDLPPSQPDEKPIWGTYTLRTSPEKAAEVLAAEERVFLIIINAPNEIVIAGDDEACKRVVKKLKWKLFPVPIKDVVHNELVKAEFDALKKLHSMPTTDIEGVDFYTAADYQKTAMEEEVIGHNIATFYTHRVDFPKLVNQVYDDGARIFIELGPQSSCTKWIDESLKTKTHLAVGINRKGVSDHTSLLRMAAKLSSHGVDMALEKLFPKTEAKEAVKPSLVKAVLVGKKPFADVILSDENRQKFHPKSRTADSTNVTQLSAAMPSNKKSARIKTTGKNNVLPIIQKNSQKNSQKITTAPISKTSIVAEQKIVNSGSNAFVNVAQNSHQETQSMHSTTTNTSTTNASSLNISSSNATVSVSTTLGTSMIGGYQSDMLRKMFQHNIKLSEMHADFMVARHDGLQALTASLINSIRSPESAQTALKTERPSTEAVTTAAPREVIQQLFPTEYNQPKDILYTEEDLREFAYGKIGKVFGPDYDIIDTYSRRVMLPMDPYLLVTRVTEMQAKKGEYVPSKMTTEYDIPHNAWYSTDGQIPTCICIESGQCDLLLISYMGIDFENKGQYMYRLLDCTLTFLDDQPKEGQTLRYEISINSFAQHKNNLLFFFSYECFVGDKMILKMDNGCAGFFSDEELAVGKGVIRTKEEIELRSKVTKSSFTPILQCQKTSFDEKDMFALMEGDLASCYGNPSYDKQGTNPSLHFPLEKILMLDRITSVDRTGGLWGLGQIEAEKELSPDEWYFTSHFRDDPVLAGSLMSEGCVQLLQFFMMYLGLHTQTVDARFQTMRNIPQPIRCRGQALPKDRLMTYRLEVTEIGLSPKPYARGNVDILIDGKIVVDFRDVCLELTEKSEAEKQLLASARSGVPISAPAPKPIIENTIKTVMPSLNKLDSRLPVMPPIEVKPALFTEEQIVHFATGDIEACFGAEFALYKQPPPTPQHPPRRPPRTPNGYLQLMHRVIDVDGDRHDFDNTVKCTAEYDVAPEVWFCAVNSHPAFSPYSMLMEIALQPNGFITSQMGSTLMYPDTNLYFRNLDGTGRLLKEIDLRGKTIVNKTSMYSTSAVMNNIIQKFTFELLVDGETFYEGDAVFGFFSADSLSNQVGMDKGKKLLPWYKEEANANAQLITFDLKSAEAQQALYAPKNNKAHYHLAGGVLDFIDESIVVADGGKFGKGYVHSMKVIDPTDWFYPCHFYKDPVMPGSLGVEAMIESIQVFALQQDLAKDFINPRFGLVEDEAKWTYRGQIIPDNKVMTLEVHIKEIRKSAGRIDIIADGNLWKDGLRIYSVQCIGLSLQEAK